MTLDFSTTGGLAGVRASVQDCRSLLAMSHPSRCEAAEGADLALHLMRSMPSGEGVDKDIWLADMTVVFADYARRDVELAVKHPIKGLKSKHKWLPAVSEVIEFLDGMAARRGRILTNARRIVQAHDERVAEVEVSPEQRAAMAERMKGLVAKLKSTPIVEPVAGKEPSPSPEQIAERKRIAEDLAARGARRAEFEAYATHVGNGDFSEGRRALVSDGIFEAPADWREKCGRQGEVA